MSTNTVVNNTGYVLYVFNSTGVPSDYQLGPGTTQSVSGTIVKASLAPNYTTAPIPISITGELTPVPSSFPNSTGLSVGFKNTTSPSNWQAYTVAAPQPGPQPTPQPGYPTTITNKTNTQIVTVLSPTKALAIAPGGTGPGAAPAVVYGPGPDSLALPSPNAAVNQGITWVNVPGTSTWYVMSPSKPPDITNLDVSLYQNSITNNTPYLVKVTAPIGKNQVQVPYNINPYTAGPIATLPNSTSTQVTVAVWSSDQVLVLLTPGVTGQFPKGVQNTYGVASFYMDTSGNITTTYAAGILYNDTNYAVITPNGDTNTTIAAGASGPVVVPVQLTVQTVKWPSGPTQLPPYNYVSGSGPIKCTPAAENNDGVLDFCIDSDAIVPDTYHLVQTLSTNVFNFTEVNLISIVNGKSVTITPGNVGPCVIPPMVSVPGGASFSGSNPSWVPAPTGWYVMTPGDIATDFAVSLFTKTLTNNTLYTVTTTLSTVLTTPTTITVQPGSFSPAMPHVPVTINLNLIPKDSESPATVTLLPNTCVNYPPINVIPNPSSIDRFCLDLTGNLYAVYLVSNFLPKTITGTSTNTLFVLSPDNVGWQPIGPKDSSQGVNYQASSTYPPQVSLNPGVMPTLVGFEGGTVCLPLPLPNTWNLSKMCIDNRGIVSATQNVVRTITNNTGVFTINSVINGTSTPIKPGASGPAAPLPIVTIPITLNPPVSTTIQGNNQDTQCILWPESVPNNSKPTIMAFCMDKDGNVFPEYDPPNLLRNNTPFTLTSRIYSGTVTILPGQIGAADLPPTVTVQLDSIPNTIEITGNNENLVNVKWPSSVSSNPFNVNAFNMRQNGPTASIWAIYSGNSVVNNSPLSLQATTATGIVTIPPNQQLPVQQMQKLAVILPPPSPPLDMSLPAAGETLLTNYPLGIINNDSIAQFSLAYEKSTDSSIYTVNAVYAGYSLLNGSMYNIKTHKGVLLQPKSSGLTNFPANLTIILDEVTSMNVTGSDQPNGEICIPFPDSVSNVNDIDNFCINNTPLGVVVSQTYKGGVLHNETRFTVYSDLEPAKPVCANEIANVSCPAHIQIAIVGDNGRMVKVPMSGFGNGDQQMDYGIYRFTLSQYTKLDATGVYLPHATLTATLLNNVLKNDTLYSVVSTLQDNSTVTIAPTATGACAWPADLKVMVDSVPLTVTGAMDGLACYTDSITLCVSQKPWGATLSQVSDYLLRVYLESTTAASFGLFTATSQVRLTEIQVGAGETRVYSVPFDLLKGDSALLVYGFKTGSGSPPLPITFSTPPLLFLGPPQIWNGPKAVGGRVEYGNGAMNISW
jgi:hypothetical protein